MKIVLEIELEYSSMTEREAMEFISDAAVKSLREGIFNESKDSIPDYTISVCIKEKVKYDAIKAGR